MFLMLWNYIRGYLIVEVSGFSIERFINMSAYRKINIWDIKRYENLVVMKVFMNGLRDVEVCCEKTGCLMSVKNKVGIPFFIKKYKKRKILLIGFFCFIVFVYFLSSFIWLVEIKGNENITYSELISFANSIGLKPGSFKGSLSEKELRSKFLDKYDSKVSWLYVDIKGTRATITINEALEKKDTTAKKPRDLIAKKDGLITGISLSSGTVQIRQNDVVKKGDLLVSGSLNSKNEFGETISQGVVAAEAEVWAKIYYSINFETPKQITNKNYTGKKKTNLSLIAFDNNIDLIKTSIMYDNYDKIKERTQLSLGENYPLPFIIVKDEYKEFENKIVPLSLDETKSLANKLLNRRIIREFSVDADIVDTIVDMQDLGDSVAVKAIVITNERIDEARELDY